MTDEQFQRIVEQYGDTIFRLAYSYLKNRADAGDVMQETLLKRCLESKPFASPEHEKHWLLRVASNECKHILRSPWRRRTNPLEDTSEIAVFDEPAQSELFCHVMSLPPKYRAAIYLHYYEGYPVQDIAELMHSKPSTVQTWLMRARGRLLTKLQEAESQ